MSRNSELVSLAGFNLQVLAISEDFPAYSQLGMPDSGEPSGSAPSPSGEQSEPTQDCDVFAVFRPSITTGSFLPLPGNPSNMFVDPSHQVMLPATVVRCPAGPCRTAASEQGCRCCVSGRGRTPELIGSNLQSSWSGKISKASRLGEHDTKLLGAISLAQSLGPSFPLSTSNRAEDVSP